VTGSGPGDLRQTLAERASWAGVIETSKAPDLDEQNDRAAETAADRPGSASNDHERDAIWSGSRGSQRLSRIAWPAS
jgi:hypothetical protein